MNHEFGLDELLFLLSGLRWTLVLSAIALVGGAVVGVLVAMARTSSLAWLRAVSGAYIAVVQGIPLLLLLFVVYFGLPLLRINFTPLLAVSIAMTLFASAYLGEIWRGGIEAVPVGQHEAAKALGLSDLARLVWIVLPQALKISLPPTVGFLVQLVKGTSLTSIIGFTEFTKTGQIISNTTFQPMLVFGLLGIGYFILCWPLSLLGSYLEQRLSRSLAR